MRRVLAGAMCAFVLAIAWASPSLADGEVVDGNAESAPDHVRVTILRLGGNDHVREVRGGSSSTVEGCSWTVTFLAEMDDVPLFGQNPGDKPHPEARLALLLCDGAIVRPVWIAPEDVIDLDELARLEAQRYVEEVLRPDISIGANPAAQGLVGLRSWFWVDGFAGSVAAPPISAFGMTIEVRMASGTITWDFGDGTVVPGDLGQAYPAESSVQHAHQRAGTYAVTASIELLPEYRVDGGPWLTLDPLVAAATVDHPVEQRQAVVTRR